MSVPANPASINIFVTLGMLLRVMKKAATEKRQFHMRGHRLRGEFGMSWPNPTIWISWLTISIVGQIEVKSAKKPRI